MTTEDPDRTQPLAADPDWFFSRPASSDGADEPDPHRQVWGLGSQQQGVQDRLSWSEQTPPADPPAATTTRLPPVPAAPMTATTAQWAPPMQSPSALAPARRRSGTARVLIAAGALALVVGGAAGVGASVLTSQVLTAAPAAPSIAPSASSAPSATPSSAPATATSVPAVGAATAVLPGTVTIRTEDGTGSGFIIDDRGTIITNNHVVASAAGSGRVSVVLADKSVVPAEILGRSPSYDLAVVRLAQDVDVSPVKLGSSADLTVGSPAIAVGSPLGLGGTVTQGIISAVDRPVVVGGDSDGQGASAYINAIQTDAPINPGNSGGPLVAADGTVIGVNSAILSLNSSGSGQGGNIGVGFAIGIDQAKQITDLLIADGEVQYPVIGAQVTSRQDGTGVQLSAVDGGSPAEAAGLRVGDTVTAVDSRPVSTATELIVALRTHRPGDEVTLRTSRGAVQVRLGGQVG